MTNTEDSRVDNSSEFFTSYDESDVPLSTIQEKEQGLKYQQ